jgi:hypothetical protein
MGSEEDYEGPPVQVRVTESAGPWSPEYLAIEKLVGYLTGVLSAEHRAGLAHAPPMQVVDLAIQIIESGRKLTIVTYELLEPRLRALIRMVAAEQEPGDGT